MQMELQSLSYAFDANAQRGSDSGFFLTLLLFSLYFREFLFIFRMSACHVFLRRIRM